MRKRIQPPGCRCRERTAEGNPVYCAVHQTFNVPNPPPRDAVVVCEQHESNYGQCGGGRRIIWREIGRA